MLSHRLLLEHEGITIEEVACRHGRGRGDAFEPAAGHALVFVRRGCFRRSSGDCDALLDPTVAFCTNPGEEARYDHPHDEGDDCTRVGLDPSLVASLSGGRRELPPTLLPAQPSIDVSHRLLLSAARRGVDPDELAERSISLAGSALEQLDSRSRRTGRPATVRARRALVDRARQTLAGDVRISLPRLAHELGVSPHHLSRVFRSQTGHTVTRHRMRLRTRHVLERLAAGERDLAQLAADAGFTDQSHLHRVVRAETGRTPFELGRTLSPDRRRD